MQWASSLQRWGRPRITSVGASECVRQSVSKEDDKNEPYSYGILPGGVVIRSYVLSDTLRS